MITSKKAANAVGGKTARACDSCVRKRARWYCAADDAFLCQGCDSSVHSANQLASRHERVLLETPSNYKPATWHEGFTRKARTPRHAKQTPPTKDVLPLVPEMVTEELALLDENEEEQLHYRVPVFDPFDNNNNNIELDDFSGFLPSDVELAEFAADVESLLGRGLDEGMEGLGPLLDCKEEDGIYDICIDDHEGRRSVKVEDEELEASHLDWNFGYESSLQVTGDEEKVVAGAGTAVMESECKGEVRRKICLRLNYESVIAAWASQGSPWTTGSRPEFNPDDCWPDFMGMCTTGVHHPNGGIGGHVRGSDGGREERVSRYREKRRTRLFSKKIRYEVRKLNAEKRPRMKGRFVKRASLAGSAFPYLMNK